MKILVRLEFFSVGTSFSITETLITFTQQIEFLVTVQQGNNLAVYSTQVQMDEGRAYMYKMLLIFNIIMTFTFDGIVVDL